MKMLVFIQPSSFEGVWKDALIRAAGAKGWKVVSLSEIDLVSDLDDYVILSSDVSPHLPDVEVVSISSFCNGADFLFSIGFTEHDALRRSAQFLAYASEVADGGGAIFDARQEVLVLPHIGEVRRAAVAEALSTSGLTTNALNIYRNLPPLIGDEAAWDSYLFAYDADGGGLSLGGGGALNLTGRARPLVFGPQITLPPGCWRMTADILVEPEGARSHLAISWGNEAGQNTRAAEIDKPGIYRVILSNVWKNSSEAEMKISSHRPHFRGSMKLLSASVSRCRENGAG